MVLWLMAQSGSKGSDVRLATGELTAPSKVKYQGIEVAWWHWEVCFGTAFRRDGHINEKELRGVLMDLMRRTRSSLSGNQRYLVLVDSQVALGVLSKKRSSSHVLNKVIRRVDALELASGMSPHFAYVRSARNPADRPSRSLPPAKRRRLNPVVIDAAEDA